MLLYTDGGSGGDSGAVRDALGVDCLREGSNWEQAGTVTEEPKEVRRLYCGLRIGGETTCMHPRRGERSPVWYLRMPRKESSGRAGVMQMEHPDRQEQEARRCRGDASMDVRCGTGVCRESLFGVV